MITDADAAVRRQPDLYPRPLWGKTVVIAGDTAGVGRATASLLMERGAKVFIAVSSPAELSAAFATMAKTGGDWDGMVVDLNQPGAVNCFFDQAERRLGRIDVLINAISEEIIPVTGSSSTPGEMDPIQGRCLQEAIRRMQHRRGGSIITIRLNGKPGLPGNLRRAARENGIRMTVIEPGAAAVYGPAGIHEFPQPLDVARCVYESLVQPFGVDVVFLRGQRQHQ